MAQNEQAVQTIASVKVLLSSMHFSATGLLVIDTFKAVLYKWLFFPPEFYVLLTFLPICWCCEKSSHLNQRSYYYIICIRFIKNIHSKSTGKFESAPKRFHIGFVEHGSGDCKSLLFLSCPKGGSHKSWIVGHPRRKRYKLTLLVRGHGCNGLPST